MASDESGGKIAAADLPQGKSENLRRLRDIQSDKDPVHLAAAVRWLIQLHPFGQIFWLWIWRLFLGACAAGAFICLVGLVWDIFSSSATLTAAKHFFPGLKNPLFDIALFFGLVVLMLCARSTRRPIVRYNKDPKRGFFLRVSFGREHCMMALAAEYNANWFWRQHKEDSSQPTYAHPSTVQNILPRLCDLQKIGRIKLRFYESSSTYFFEPRRWFLKDFLEMSIGIVLVIVAFALSTDIFASRQSSLLNIAAAFLALLVGIIGIAIMLHIFWQRWKASMAWVAVVFSQDRTTATLAWNQHLSFRKGFHCNAALLDEIEALDELCKRLLKMQEKGELIKLSKES